MGFCGSDRCRRITICRACRSSVSSPSSLDTSCFALSSRLNEGFFCKVSSNCLSAAFSCADGGPAVLCTALPSQNPQPALSVQRIHPKPYPTRQSILLLRLQLFRPASIIAISLRNASAPASSAYSNFAKGVPFRNAVPLNLPSALQCGQPAPCGVSHGILAMPFLGNQCYAFLALFLDLLHQTGVTLQLRLPYGKGF